MRKLLVTLLLLALAGPAGAQTRIVTYLAGTATVPGAATAGIVNVAGINDTVTSLAAMTAAEQSWPTSAQFSAESTGVFGSGTFPHIALYLRGIPAAATDTTSKITLAVAVKMGGAPTGGTYADSLLALSYPREVTAGFGSGPVPPAGGGGGYWPGEYKIVLDPWEGRTAAGNVPSNRMFGTTTKRVDLNDLLGLANLGDRLMQVRVRVLNYFDSDKTKKCRIQGWVVGEN